MDKFKIKDIFSFEKKIYNQAYSKKRLKRLISLLISVIILVVTIFLLVKIGYTMNSPKYLLGDGNYSYNFLQIIYISFFILAIVLFFIVFYKFLSFISVYSDSDILSSRCYVLTNDNSFFSLKFIEKFNKYAYNSSKTNVLDKTIMLSLRKLSLKKSQKGIDRKIQNKDINTDDLVECLEIVNVYKVFEKDDKIKFVCDYIDLLNDVYCKKKEIIIYKFFINWEKILEYLKEKENQQKVNIKGYKEGEHVGFVNFIINCCLNSTNKVGLYLIVLLIIWAIFIKRDFLLAIIYAELALSGLSIILYCEKQAFKFSDFKFKNDKTIILSKIKRHFVLIFSFCLLLIVLLFITKISISEFLFSLFFIGFFVVMIIWKISKN